MARHKLIGKDFRCLFRRSFRRFDCPPPSIGSRFCPVVIRSFCVFWSQWFITLFTSHSRDIIKRNRVSIWMVGWFILCLISLYSNSSRKQIKFIPFAIKAVWGMLINIRFLPNVLYSNETQLLEYSHELRILIYINTRQWSGTKIEYHL